MGLSSLPPELILMVAESLDSEKAINPLTRTNRFFYSLLNPFLYRFHARTNIQLSALLHAARRNLPGVIEHLIDAGVSLHSRKAWFYPESHYDQIDKFDHPIALAAYSGNANVMETLLDKEELTSGLTEQYFFNMMYCAVWDNQVKVVKVLLDRKVTDPWTDDPIIASAAERGRVDIVNLLLKDADERIKTGLLSETVRQRGIDEALLQGMGTQNPKNILTLLLKAGADVNFVAKWGRIHLVPLGEAAHYKHVGAVKLLLEAGADPNLMRNRKWGPLARAIQPWHGDITYSWDPPGHDLEDPSRQPLPRPMSPSVREIFRLLFEYGAKPSRAGGSWALHRAVVYQCYEAAHLLIDKGAQITPSHVNDSQQAALNQAVADRDFEAIKALVPKEWSTDA